MLLSMAEYDFEVEHQPGIRNILADYGTRQIDVSEWDKPPEDDPEGIHELLVFEEMGANFFSISFITEEDTQQMDKLSLERWEYKGVMVVNYKKRPYIWLPISSKRAFFWEIHTTKHLGCSKILHILKEDGIFWHHAAKEIGEYLSQCICTVKKDDSPRKYTDKARITARHPLHILAIDLYTYKASEYFTAICIFLLLVSKSGE